MKFERKPVGAKTGESRQPKEWPVESEAAIVRDSRQRWSLLRGGKRAGVAQDSWGSRGGMHPGKPLHLKIWSRNSALSEVDVDKNLNENCPGGEQRIDAGWQLAE